LVNQFIFKLRYFDHIHILYTYKFNNNDTGTRMLRLNVINIRNRGMLRNRVILGEMPYDPREVKEIKA